MNKPTIIILLLVASILSACTQISYPELEVKETNLVEIRNLTRHLEDMGPRNAGTAEEESTAKLIQEKLKKAGISTNTEEFSFETVSIIEAKLSISDRSIKPLFLGINPYIEEISGEKKALVFDPEAEHNISLENMIVLSDNPDYFFYALQRGAKGFVNISPEEFASLKRNDILDIELDITGKQEQRNSANIVADIGLHPDDTETIYITAHYDSYLDSPGANDNGTGLSSAIELAKLLKSAEKSLPLNVKIIFFAAEEIGLVGSREYISSHLTELSTCKCLINLDTFGGNESPYIAAAPGINGSPTEGYVDPCPDIMKKRALEGPAGAWRLFDPALFNIIISSNYPKWYQDIVASSAQKLDYDIINQQLMSDHLTFAAAGVPSISIQSRDHTIHSKDDIVENINFDSVKRCLSLTLQIVKDVMDNSLN